MPQPLPFAISGPALTHLLDLLEKAAAFGGGFEPGLVRCFGYESGDPAGRITERLMEEHFTLAGDLPNQVAGSPRLDPSSDWEACSMAASCDVGCFAREDAPW
jgi:hypothetical protein